MKLFLLFILVFPTIIHAECTDMVLGKRCFEKIANYPQPVFIFIPKQFKPENSFSLLLFFHGHILNNSNYQNDVIERFQFEQKLSHLKRNLIMVMPMSTGLGTDYDDYFFKTPKAHENFQNFSSDLFNTLIRLGVKNENQNNLILAGHSGAYRHLATFMKYDIPNFNELYLFDCLYSKYDAAKTFAETYLKFKQENKRILSFYKIGSSTDVANYETWLGTKENTQQNSKAKFYQESLTLDKRYKRNKRNNPQQDFIKSNKNHYQIVDDFFIWALESGELNRKKSLP